MRFVSHVATPDGTKGPGALELVRHVNGAGRQRPPVRQMTFDIPRIINQLPAGPRHGPGDIIVTGAPFSVGHAMAPPRRRRAGDVVPGGGGGIGTPRTPIEWFRA